MVFLLRNLTEFVFKFSANYDQIDSTKWLDFFSLIFQISYFLSNFQPLSSKGVSFIRREYLFNIEYIERWMKKKNNIWFKLN